MMNRKGIHKPRRGGGHYHYTYRMFPREHLKSRGSDDLTLWGGGGFNSQQLQSVIELHVPADVKSSRLLKRTT